VGAPTSAPFVIKLRPNVKFHDGEPFNAEAVKFNIERSLTTEGSFRKPEIGTDLERGRPQRPDGAAQPVRAPGAPAGRPDRSRRHDDLAQGRPALGDKFGTKPVCAGPYKFVERVAQGKIAFERFADYWDKANIHIDRVEFVPILDSTARLASLRSGDLHMIERASPTDLPEIRGDSRLKVAGVPELGYQMIPLNVANGPKGKTLADVRVRQAIDLSIDRETLIKTVFNNEYIPGNQWISPTSYYYNAKLPVRKRDVAKARQLLQQPGSPTSRSRSSCHPSAIARRPPRSSRPCWPRPGSR
jgi:peptide/nickel transport system substrate-binding protein